MKGQNTTNRLPREAPTEPGWYYAKNKRNNEWEILHVIMHRGFPRITEAGGLWPQEIFDEFIWFGPVATCIEA